MDHLLCHGYGDPANTVSSRIETVLSYVLILDFERLAEHPLPYNELKTLLKLFAAIRYMFTNNMRIRDSIPLKNSCKILSI